MTDGNSSTPDDGENDHVMYDHFRDALLEWIGPPEFKGSDTEMRSLYVTLHGLGLLADPIEYEARLKRGSKRRHPSSRNSDVENTEE